MGAGTDMKRSLNQGTSESLREPLPPDGRQPGEPKSSLADLKIWLKMTKSEKSLKVYNDLLKAIHGKNLLDSQSCTE